MRASTSENWPERGQELALLSLERRESWEREREARSFAPRDSPSPFPALALELTAATVAEATAAQRPTLHAADLEPNSADSPTSPAPIVRSTTTNPSPTLARSHVAPLGRAPVHTHSPAHSIHPHTLNPPRPALIHHPARSVRLDSRSLIPEHRQRTPSAGSLSASIYPHSVTVRAKPPASPP